MRFPLSRLSMFALCIAAVFAMSTAPTVRAYSMATLSSVRRAPVVAQPDDSLRDFAKLVAELSEPGGYFDTDNLISNEGSFLQVMGGLDRMQVRGGAYLGVGPDQNFSYIARIKPRIALLIDIRRDNLLQHLLFKALFGRAHDRTEYLALWLGLPPAAQSNKSSDTSAAKPIEQIVADIDTRRATVASMRNAHDIVQHDVQQYGIPLTAAELTTIERFHSAFMTSGLSLRFTSTGRSARDYYPTLRQLILARDLDGHLASYLAHEDDFRFVKSLQRRNLIVPVVGDLGGAHALPAIAKLLAQRGDKLSAVYASNAEDYVMRDGGFPRYAQSMLAMPRDAHSVFIRSWFGGGASHPENISGYYSTQLLQTVDDFARDMGAGGYSSYYELTHRHFVPSRP